ncbi:hypothetical protein GWO43_06110, partial [candidate division KSB1 bacterium]|nr:hypothetical protein [candidate division KSB1 bacterium]NIR72387.1 hypothetical protein [candidate division KSB1 bacterium]NIS26730.1 hypothetical protein [candidate division KSB1 bacterium]NIT70462.1 hypothetical protein [candidate division KSB1 bacterium]NIU24160.1 hypothetical protein [candidate division KSB1 bacterium]
DHSIDLAPALKTLRDEVDKLLYEEGFNTSSITEMASKLKADPESIHEALSYMLNAKEVVRVEEDIYFHSKRIEEAREKLVSYLNKNEKITVSQFKDLLHGASRKYALPLLIHFDSVGLTERDGDVRILR